MTEPVSFHDVEQTLEAAQAKRYAAYPVYRPSGVDWLGDVPEHWSVERAHFRLKSSAIQISQEAFADQEVFHYSIPIIQETGDGHLEAGDEIGSSKLLITKPVILVSKLNPRKNTVLSVHPREVLTVCSTEFVPIDPCSSASRYVEYMYQSESVRQQLDSQVQSVTRSHQRVTPDIIRKVSWAWPPEDEQQAIARFLDEQTEKIDDLIEAKRDLLALLKEKRQAVITHAVTKGLNPDARLKPSGVDWLGDVPEHWDVKSLKWDSPVLRGASPRPIDDPIYFDDEGEYAWVRIADVTAAGMYLEQTTQRLSKLGSSLSVKLQPGELFLSIAGSVGKPCITKIKCCIHDGFVYFPRLSCNRKFLYYIFASGEPYKGLGKLGTQLNLNTDTVGSIHIAFPPDDEQEQIVEYLDAEMTKFDGLIEAVDGAIEKLATLRISLISAAVTGKIDVRGGAE